MANAIHHINFLVRDLSQAIPVWERILDQPVAAREELESRGIISARFNLGGTWLVLVQPTRADTVPARHLEQHGEGFFLLSLEVDSLDAEADRLGQDWLSGPARQGIENWHIQDLDVGRTFGAQIQFAIEG